nr:hypothetical protein [Lachnospiraceae bacterium]
SLAIGGALYFFVIRKLAAKNGGYGKKSAAANDRNRKQASREVSVGETLLWIAKGSVSCIAGMIRLINYGMDAPVKLFVRFLKKEQKKDERHTPIYGIIGRALTGNRDEFYPIAGGFSFALMMTCAGILIIMFVLIFTIM